MAEPMTVEVVCLHAADVFRRTLSLPEGSTVAEALRASGVARMLDAGSLDDAPVGVFSRRVTMNHPLQDGDRVELYRPLQRDPKEARRQRAGGG